MTIFWTIIGVFAAIGVVVAWLYNSLVRSKNRSKEAWSDIEVQMKRRYDLIPNVVATVKGYAAHESGIFERVTQARTQAMGAKTAGEHASAENALSNTLKTLFAVSENYPDLKANANFLDLQRELADTENKIQASRRFYNGNVRDLNIKIESFPTNLIANAFGFTKMGFFDLDNEAAKEPVKVGF